MARGMRNRRRRTAGVVPRLWRGLGTAALWSLRHAQPVLVLGVLALVLWASWGTLCRSPAFTIRQVSLPAPSSLKPPESLIGSNLWSVDLQALSRQLLAQQPWLKEVQVVRQMPDTLRIMAVERIPVAQVHFEQAYLVDQEGVLLPQTDPEATANLVRIVGADRGERLRLGLRVLEQVRRAPVSISRQLTEIHVDNPHEIRLMLEGDTEVRCGAETELTANIERLRAALKALAKQQLAARYIDVRFPEPVIGPRT